MKVSTDDPDHDHSKRYVVTVDDVEVKECFTADEEEGYVECALRDAEGYLVVDHLKNEVRRQRITGHVVISLVQ